jgi:hypothetical protein
MFNGKTVDFVFTQVICKVCLSHENELDRYEKLFNTAYAVAKNNRPFSDYTFLAHLRLLYQD